MKHFLRRQLTNIVFLILIVAAALTIFLLSRADAAAEPAFTTSASPTPAPAPTAAPSGQASARGVPEAVFATHLESSDRFEAAASKKDSRAYTLTYGSSPAVSADLSYTTDSGCVSSLEITFALPAEQEKSKGSQSSIEDYLYEAAQASAQVLPDALRSLLVDLLPACDAQSRLKPAIARYWAEQTLLLDKAGDDFEDTGSGCHFLSYRAERNDQDYLVCVLSFD